MGKKIKQGKNHNFTDYMLLYFALFVYSLGSIFNKLASQYPTLSMKFIFFYSTDLLTLFIYAIIWQKVLKKFELSIAYANRPLVTVLAMLWGVLLFHEQLSWNMLLGTAIIAFGIRIIVTEEGE